VTIAIENLPDDIAALKQIIGDLTGDAVVAQAEIAKLQFQLARYRRAEFGRSSEKLARDIDQLELAIETVKIDQAERLAAQPPAVAALIRSSGRSAETGAPASARASAARRGGSPGAMHLPTLRRDAAQDRRGRHRDARLCARPLQGNPPSAREARLPGL
jgi:hypothetical protein